MGLHGSTFPPTTPQTQTYAVDFKELNIMSLLIMTAPLKLCFDTPIDE